MKLTGKCKEDFEKFRISKKDSYLKHCFFDELEPSMQYGVYVDFFDSVGVNISESLVFTLERHGYSFSIELYSDYEIYKTRPEARTSAIQKANEIYNLK